MNKINKFWLILSKVSQLIKSSWNHLTEVWSLAVDGGGGPDAGNIGAGDDGPDLGPAFEVFL